MAAEGPLSPSTIADVSGVGTRVWSSPSNAVSQNDTYASVTTANNSTGISHWLQATNFGFSIPGGATINGVTVEIDRFAVEDFGPTVDSALRLVRAGTIETSNHSSPGWGQNGADGNVYDVIGGIADLWGASWSATDINDTGFGFAMSVSLGKNDVANVDHIRITVTYTVAASGGGPNRMFTVSSTKAVSAIQKQSLLVPIGFPVT